MKAEARLAAVFYFYAAAKFLACVEFLKISKCPLHLRFGVLPEADNGASIFKE